MGRQTDNRWAGMQTDRQQMGGRQAGNINKKMRNSYKILVLKSQKGTDDLEHLGIDRRTILKSVLEKQDFLEVNIIQLAQDSDNWQGCSNTLVNLPVPYMSGYI